MITDKVYVHPNQEALLELKNQAIGILNARIRDLDKKQEEKKPKQKRAAKIDQMQNMVKLLRTTSELGWYAWVEDMLANKPFARFKIKISKYVLRGDLTQIALENLLKHAKDLFTSERVNDDSMFVRANKPAPLNEYARENRLNTDYPSRSATPLSFLEQHMLNNPEDTKTESANKSQKLQSNPTPRRTPKSTQTPKDEFKNQVLIKSASKAVSVPSTSSYAVISKSSPRNTPITPDEIPVVTRTPPKEKHDKTFTPKFSDATTSPSVFHFSETEEEMYQRKLTEGVAAREKRSMRELATKNTEAALKKGEEQFAKLQKQGYITPRSDSSSTPKTPSKINNSPASRVSSPSQMFSQSPRGTNAVTDSKNKLSPRKMK